MLRPPTHRPAAGQAAVRMRLGQHPERGVTAIVVVLLDPRGHSDPGLGLGGEVLELAELELQRRVPAPDDRVVHRRAHPAHGLLDAYPTTGGLEVFRGVLAALVGMQNHPGDGVLAPADCDRHLQPGLGQVGVAVLADGEPDDAARPHVQHRVQVELARLP